MSKINFLSEVMEEPMRREVLLDLVLSMEEGPVGDVKTGAASSAAVASWWSSGCMQKMQSNK